MSAKAGLRRWVGLTVIVVAGGLLHPVRTRAAALWSGLRETSDTYALPSAVGTKVLSLGYRSAVADLIYAHVLVDYGLHFQAKRRFEHVGDYLDVITRLDPLFEEPYLLSDTLLTLQPEPPRQVDYWRARELLLRGTEALPFNRKVFVGAGQYIAYLAAPHLDSRDDELRWRVEGAKLLARACELSNGDEQEGTGACLGAARYLNQAGERDALIRMMTHAIAVNDDAATRDEALRVLAKYAGEQEREQYAEREDKFRARWVSDLPHVSKERLLVLGPGFPALACLGRRDEKRCLATWRDWGQGFAAR